MHTVVFVDVHVSSCKHTHIMGGKNKRRTNSFKSIEIIRDALVVILKKLKLSRVSKILLLATTFLLVVILGRRKLKTFFQDGEFKISQHGCSVPLLNRLKSI